MVSFFHSSLAARRSVMIFMLAIFLAAAFVSARTALPDQPSFDTVGAIEGEAITVSGSLNVEVVHGQTRTILRSGSDVRVTSGQARIDLVEGGTILVCGPAHFSVLKSASLLTLALDYGIVHAHIVREPALTIYTAQLQAKPVAIGDTPQDTLVGFDAAGAMCVRASSGAVRLEQQFTGQNVVVPQGGDVLIPHGQLDSLTTSAQHCSCEQPVARAPVAPAPPAPPTVGPSTEVSRLASEEEVRRMQAEANAKSSESQPSAQTLPTREEPIYQVFMPPLTYGPSDKVQQEFDPKLIVLVRRVRVRSALVYQGRVEGEPPVAVASAGPAPGPAAADPHASPQAASKPAQPATDDSMFGRVRSFLHHLWTPAS